MAKKRMFSLEVVDSDAFLDMPQTAQNLYFHLGMRADDDGFIGNYRRLVGYIGAKNSDMNELINKRFVLIIGNIAVIKHWRINNNIYKDRYTPTSYQDEFSALTIKDNKSYTECNQDNYKNDYKNVSKSDYSRVSINATNGDYLDIDIDSDIDLEENKISLVQSGDVHGTDKKAESNGELEAFYDSIWKLYPIKKGKGQVSKTKKKVLQRIGYDEIKRCIERFSEDMEACGRDKKYWMHGSTFFNSGYVDYLDENYGEVCREDNEAENSESADRFYALEPSKRAELESSGVIDGQTLLIGNATDEQIKYLQDCGVF